MGGRQSRIDHSNSKTEDTDDWMSRVEVKPSMRLVARLEQQRNQGVIGAATEAFKADNDDEERSKQEESSEHAVHQEVS